jgi:hypothetical protein
MKIVKNRSAEGLSITSNISERTRQQHAPGRRSAVQ